MFQHRTLSQNTQRRHLLYAIMHFLLFQPPAAIPFSWSTKVRNLYCFLLFILLHIPLYFKEPSPQSKVFKFKGPGPAQAQL
jgi:hypothetical protein